MRPLRLHWVGSMPQAKCTPSPKALCQQPHWEFHNIGELTMGSWTARHYPGGRGDTSQVVSGLHEDGNCPL